MSFKKRVIPALVASAMLMSAPAVQAVQFSGVYVFGDSLSDAGYYRPGLAAAFGSSAAAAGIGRFTTNPGPVWSELIAQYYGGRASSSNAGGGIYAQGGMQATGDAPASRLGPGGTQRPAATQISEYLASNGGTANPNALYAVWFGANDIFTQLELVSVGAISPAVFQANALGAANAEVAQIARLQAAGARYILAFNLPDIGATPAFAGSATAATVSAIGAGYNTTLFTSLKAANVKVIPVDVATLLSDVRANFSAFGFTNIVAPACLPLGSSSLTCSAANFPSGAANTYLYADSVHPTTAAHAIVADFVKSLIDGPNAYSMLAEVPLSSRASHVRTLDEGLRAGQLAEVGKVVAFAAGDGGKSDISANSLSPQSNTKNRAGSVGVTMRASEALTVGLALGVANADTTLGSAGSFNLDETAFSLFASLKSGGLYGNFTATSADLRFKDMQRNVKLGIVNRVARASAKGSNVSSSLAVGYDFNFGQLSAGPFASLTSQSVDVADFTETGSGAADLNIFKQERSSRVSSFGMRGSVALGNWTPFARVSVDKEETNKDRFISANPVSVAAGLSYDIPGYKGDQSWVTGTIGVRGVINQRIGVSVAYSAVSSKDGVKQDGVTAGVSLGF